MAACTQHLVVMSELHNKGYMRVGYSPLYELLIIPITNFKAQVAEI